MNEEDRRVARWTRHWPSRGVWLGPGDDCALLAPPPAGHAAVLKTDAVAEGVHFTLQDPPALVGRKALARALSDFAAMGALPQAALITIGLPRGQGYGRFADAVYDGMARAARHHRIALAGGETTRASGLWFSVALCGHVERKLAVARSGARAGDLLFVTGKLGATRAGHHLRFTPRLREGRWLAANRLAAAMMDLSDGLGADLPRLARASGVSFEIDPAALPRRRGATILEAVNDGEDYELLFAVRPRHAARLLASWPFATPLARIGRLLPPGQKPRTAGIPFHGHDHLRREGAPI